MAKLPTEVIVEATDVATLLDELKLEYQQTANCFTMSCPLGTHQDSNPSFLFYPEPKTFECKACGAKGDVISFLALITKKDRAAAAIWLAKRFQAKIKVTIDPRDVETWHEQLLRPEHKRWLDILTGRKGLSREAIVLRRIGLDADRITIPIRDSDGSFVNIRYYNPFASKGRDKYKNYRDGSTLELTPWESLSSPVVFVTEGEFKAFALLDRGYVGISPTSGANTWKSEWSELFRGKTVYLVFDVDQPGQKAARIIAKNLYAFAKIVYLVNIPIDVQKFPKGDVCDFFGSSNNGTKEQFDAAVRAAKPWQPQQLREPERDNEIYKVSLAAATSSKLHAKRVQTKAIVSAKDTAPYLVPRRIVVACDRDQKCCAECPIFAQEVNADIGGVEVELDAESPKLLELIDVPTSKLDSTVRSAVGIPDRCGSSTCRSVESFAIEEVRLVPQINTASDDTGAAVVRAYYVGHGIETNASYEILMRVYPDAKTQHAVGLIYEAKPDADNLGTFEVTPDMRTKFRIFQSASASPEDIKKKLAEIYSDLETNVTRIYQRRDLHLFMDLIWHTALWITFDGQVVKGWGDGIVIGDSGQGKSEVSRNLRSHYQLGERLDSKSATVAGLLGGLQESHKRWIIQWGAIPLNDKRLVILEEVKGMAEEVIHKLTDMRSSGIAELVKIEKRKTNARTRLIWITNPRSQRQMATYNHGIEAIKEFAGSLEDVRRYDMAIVVASGQVPREICNMERSTRPKHDHVFESDLCRDLLLWAWSRQAADIVFPPETVRAVLAAASEMGSIYSSSIPLVEPADQRFKLARLAAALAIRLFSCDSKGRVLVEPGHVAVCLEFLRRLYDDPVMGYGEFSKGIHAEEQIADPAEVQRVLLLTKYPRDLIVAFQRNKLIRVEDIMNFSGADRDGASALIGVLVRKNALLAIKGAYVKTPAFISLLRTVLASEELRAAEELHKAFQSAAGSPASKGGEF